MKKEEQHVSHKNRTNKRTSVHTEREKKPYQLVHKVGALGVGGDLCLEVADVVLQVAGAEVALELARGLQQLRHARLLEDAVAHQLERDDSRALLYQGLF